MDEKRSETKLAVTGVMGILVALLPTVAVGLKAVMDAGLVANGTWAYVACFTGIAVCGALVKGIITHYTNKRTEIKVARMNTETQLGTSTGSVRTPVPTVTGEAHE